MNKMKVKVTIDRPKGYKDKFGNVYPINYGFIDGVIGGDGEEQDVYVISKEITEAIDTFEGEIVAIVHRKNDSEEKWVATKMGEQISLEDIKENTYFMEQFFDTQIEVL